jgi:hypothetical protein
MTEQGRTRARARLERRLFGSQTPRGWALDTQFCHETGRAKGNWCVCVDKEGTSGPRPCSSASAFTWPRVGHLRSASPSHRTRCSSPAPDHLRESFGGRFWCGPLAKQMFGATYEGIAHFIEAKRMVCGTADANAHGDAQLPGMRGKIVLPLGA